MNRHVPNLITMARIAAVPWIVWLLLGGEFQGALAWFLVVAATDSLDGWMARKYGWESRFGALMDPLADKGLLVATYVSLGWLGAMPRWLVAIVLGRDVLILAFAAAVLALSKLRDFPPTRWGKLSTFFQILAAGAVMVRYSVWPGVPLMPFLAFAGAWTVGSGLHYLATAVQRLTAPALRL